MHLLFVHNVRGLIVGPLKAPRYVLTGKALAYVITVSKIGHSCMTELVGCSRTTVSPKTFASRNSNATMGMCVFPTCTNARAWSPI